MNGGRAFGPRAQAWYQLLGDAPVVLSDLEYVADALYWALQMRTRGERFYAGIVIEDPRSALAPTVSRVVFGQPRSRQDVAILLDAFSYGALTIENKPQAELEKLSYHHVNAAQDLLRLSDGLIVRSSTEFTRLRGAAEWLPRRTVYDVRPHTIPRPQLCLTRDRIVVWMPDEPAERAVMLAFALEELHYQTIVVCNATAGFEGLRAQFVGLAGAAEALGRAFVIVDGNATDPGAALALCALGLPMAVTTTSGAGDWVDNVSAYPPSARRNTALAVQDALGLGPARPSAAGLSALQRLSTGPTIVLDPPPPVDGPRVSIVVRTYNRKHFLRRALRSVAAQTYRNIETIIVNDAGESVVDVASEFPGVILVEHETNRGLAEARNSGVDVATGTYLGFLDDDDAYFPEHVAMLVAALQRSDAVMAYANTISQYVRRQADGSYRTYGIRSEFFGTVNAWDLLVVNSFPPVSMLLRREALVSAGRFEQWCEPMEDHEMWLRMLVRGDVTHVDLMTSVYSRRDDGSNLIVSSWPKHGAVLSGIHARYPVPGRPDIEARRAALIADSKAPEAPVAPPLFTYDQPFPL